MTTAVHFVIASSIKSPYKHCPQVKWYQTVRMAQEVETLCQPATVLCYAYIAYLVLYLQLQ
jgi:hypothetical protein